MNAPLSCKLLLIITVKFSVLVCAMCGGPAPSYAQQDPIHRLPPIEITKKEDINDLKTLIAEAKKLEEEKNQCSKTAKDIKQECFCDKSAEYDELKKLTNDITLPEHRRNWFDSLLRFEANGKTVTTSLTNFHKVEYEFNDACLPNDDGSYRANHEFDKPITKVTDADDVRNLTFLRTEKRKWTFKHAACWTSRKYSKEQCDCGYKPKFKALLKYVSALLRAHPEWSDHVLSIMVKSHAIEVSLEKETRELHNLANACKK